jgi:hypothetical protein
LNEITIVSREKPSLLKSVQNGLKARLSKLNEKFKQADMNQNNAMNEHGTAEYRTIFKDKSIGMSLEVDEEEEFVIVKEFKPAKGSYISDISIRPGHQIVAVNEEPVDGYTFDQTLQLLKDSPRPMTVTFSDPALQGEAYVCCRVCERYIQPDLLYEHTQYCIMLNKNTLEAKTVNERLQKLLVAIQARLDAEDEMEMPRSPQQQLPQRDLYIRALHELQEIGKRAQGFSDRSPESVQEIMRLEVQLKEQIIRTDKQLKEWEKDQQYLSPTGARSGAGAGDELSPSVLNTTSPTGAGRTSRLFGRTSKTPPGIPSPTGSIYSEGIPSPPRGSFDRAAFEGGTRGAFEGSPVRFTQKGLSRMKRVQKLRLRLLHMIQTKLRSVKNLQKSWLGLSKTQLSSQTNRLSRSLKDLRRNKTLNNGRGEASGESGAGESEGVGGEVADGGSGSAEGAAVGNGVGSSGVNTGSGAGGSQDASGAGGGRSLSQQFPKFRRAFSMTAMDMNVVRELVPVASSIQSEVGIKDFELLKPISKGAYGRVYLCRKKTTKDIYAIKVIDKKNKSERRERKNQNQSAVQAKHVQVKNGPNGTTNGITNGQQTKGTTNGQQNSAENQNHDQFIHIISPTTIHRQQKEINKQTAVQQNHARVNT